MPLGIALAGGEGQNFQRMAVRVAKIKCADAAGVLVPIGQSLRAWRSVLYFVPAQPSVRAVHIPDDQRYVLKPAIVAARIGRRGTAFRRQVLGKLDELIAETQSGGAQA